MESEKAAASLKVYEEEIEEQLRGKTFFEYLAPSPQESKNPCRTLKLNLDDQALSVEPPNPATARSALSNETPAFPTKVKKVETTVPVSVETTASIPVSTLSLTNPLVGSMSTVPATMSGN